MLLFVGYVGVTSLEFIGINGIPVDEEVHNWTVICTQVAKQLIEATDG